MRHIFVTGGTGYIGRPLICELLAAGHRVRALVRPGSETKLPGKCGRVLGDALSDGYGHAVEGCDTFVHLIGVPHPSPAKAALFRSVDLASIEAAVACASAARVRHFVYVSVAQPAPVMHAYAGVRAQGEGLIRTAGFNATILRPWYVIGPGHRWPLALKPLYWIAERLPGTSTGARRLGLVTLDQMVSALVEAVQTPQPGIRIVEVPQIRRGAAASANSR